MGANFGECHRGFTQTQLASTASYQAKDLQGIQLESNDLTGWDFSGQNLTSASLPSSTLTNANLSRGQPYERDSVFLDPNLRQSDRGQSHRRGSLWLDADECQSVGGGGDRGRLQSKLGRHRHMVFTQAQLASTASYQAKELQGIGLTWTDLTGWDLRGQNLTNASLSCSNLTGANLIGASLTNASLSCSNLTGANLRGAVVTGASFDSTTSHGFTKEQLYLTLSYQSRDLRQIQLRGNDLSGWDFSGQILTNAELGESTLTNADLTGADVTGTSFRDTTSRGFTQQQLYSTQSYQSRNLRGIRLEINHFDGWDFSGQDLTNAKLNDAGLTNANFTGANLTNVNLVKSRLNGANLTGANLKNAFLSNISDIFDATTVYNQWTVFPNYPRRFDPVAAGLTLQPSPTGDLDANDVLDTADVDNLVYKMRTGQAQPTWLPNAAYDFNHDGDVNPEDHRFWVKELLAGTRGLVTPTSMASSTVRDFVLVFSVAGKYDGKGLGRSVGALLGNGAGWSEGDWNGDGVFDSGDFVVAFEDGGYEQGPRTDVAAVPEPAAWTLLVIGLVALVVRSADLCQLRTRSWTPAEVT